MSEWNNGYSYNNRQQDHLNPWNADVNSQYMQQDPNYYSSRQYEPSSQYVNFNEFISQIQNNGSVPPPNGTNYNSAQYQNYSVNNYSELPSSSSSNPQLDSFNYGPNISMNITNGSEIYQSNIQNQQNPILVQGMDNYQDQTGFKSNLTATATEFVPKNTAVDQSTSSHNYPLLESASCSNDHPIETSSSKMFSQKEHASNINCVAESSSTKNHDELESSSTQIQNEVDPASTNNVSNSNRNTASGRNWRDRPSSTCQSNDQPDKGRNYRNYDSSSRNNEPSGSNQDSYKNNHNQRNQESSYSMQESAQENQDSAQRNQGYRQESNSRYEEGSRSYDNSKGQSKTNSKYNQNKETDAGRTFYNSKNSQDVRSGKGDTRSDRGDSRLVKEGPANRNKKWAGSQRVRPERNYVDDEQFANSYLQYRSDKREDRRYDRREDSRDDKKEDRRDDRRDDTRDDRREFRRDDRREDRRDDRREDRRDDRRETKRDDRREDRRDDRRDGGGGRVQGTGSPMKSRNKNVIPEHIANSEMTQRERLSEQLDKGTLECLVCCERVKQTDTVWSCTNCYHVLHLRCIRKWAMSSLQEGKWRCPACQNASDTIPTEYRCMCGAVRNPEWQRGGGGAGAHTCGRACRRARSCPHPCTLPCHPGPCPPCQATVAKQCGCGAETRSVLCSSKLAQLCGGVCRRRLDCGAHECGLACHEGACRTCEQTVTQVCHCPAASTRTVPCTAATSQERAWSCTDTCARVLACGAHVCRATCHAPPCERCALEPDLIVTCPCGKNKLEAGKRKSCTDPIPLCGNICAKPLSCGPAGDRHFCKLECHEGACPVCPDSTLLPCRCGHSSRDVPCCDLAAAIDNVLCQKKCNKKLSCGRHRCRTLCCSDAAHRCPVVCGRTLSCQLHRCEATCHTGHCPPCPVVSFSELSCACGAEFLLPPVRCGTRPPPCSAPCRAPRGCGHEAHHACHPGPCPPCVVLTARFCHGGHEERKTIPCSLEGFSCGLPCGKPLPCGKHTCIKFCHKGPCDTDTCTQPCQAARSCGHPCGAPCHRAGAAVSRTCPAAAPCRRAVTVTCLCGRRTLTRGCAENAAIHNKMMSALAAAKMQEGASVDISDLSRPGANLKTLECDDECRVERRTRQMALALQIRNPDVSAKLAPRYSEHVRACAQKDAALAKHVHDKLTDLVQLAKKSKQKTRSHSFPSMNWQKRQFVHELCEHFGCESVAYDAEPNRNVVATADREKSWLPAMSVLEVLSREAGKRRVPGPMLRSGAPVAPGQATSGAAGGGTNKSSGPGWATLTSSNAWAARQPVPAPAPAPAAAPAPAPAPAPRVDYFDNPPE